MCVGAHSENVPEKVERPLSMTQVGGITNGFRDKVFGPSDGLHRGVAKDQMTEQRGGKRATRTMGGVGFDVVPGVPMHFSRRQQKEIGGLRVIAGGGNNVQMGVPLRQCVGSSLSLGETLDRKSRQP